MKSGNLFKESTFHRNKLSSSYSGYLADDDATAGKQINLVRDNELYMGVQLEVDNVTQNYVKKGELGSCWVFLSPRAWICEIHVVPKDQNLDKGYAGIFYFRFWQYGRWWRWRWISSFQSQSRSPMSTKKIFLVSYVGPCKEALGGLDKHLYDEMVKALIFVLICYLLSLV